jgi:hypothetical protein
MCSDKSDVEDAMRVLHKYDNTVTVSFDIEYNPIIGQKTGISVHAFYVYRRLPLGVSDVVMPSL